MTQRRRSAFTLTQLVVLLALLLLLFGFLFSAVFRVRSAAFRSTSQNNLKQIGLATHGYYDARGAMPPGVDANGFSAATYLLPFIEQDAVYNQIDLKKSVNDKANELGRNVVIKTYLSPGDPLMSVNQHGATNYLYSAGSKAALKDNNGLFFEMSKVRFPDVRDGLSNTLLAGETLKGDGNTRGMDVRRQHVALKEDALKGLKADSGVEDFKNSKNVVGTRCASWMSGAFLQGTFTATRMLNDEKPDVDCGGKGGLSGLRSMADGSNIALADGSVRYISNKVGLDIWQKLADRDDGQPLPEF